MQPTPPPEQNLPSRRPCHQQHPRMRLSTTLLLLSASPACALRSVLVVGGNGRVGASTVRWLHKLAAAEDLPLELCIGGRRRDSFDAAAARLARQGVADVSFVPLDLEEPATLGAAVAGRSLVVHTAGPFQQREDPALLQACIEAGVPYCDVCDELLLSRNAKALGEQAVAAGVPAVLSCGIWPGVRSGARWAPPSAGASPVSRRAPYLPISGQVSALMAAEAVERLGGNGSCERLEFSFFTAGTGGAGPTIVSATFLLLCTPVATYQGGRLVELEPWTERRLADFGEGIGERECYLLDNPDVPTCAEALSARSRDAAQPRPRTARPPPPWTISRLGPLLRTPERRLSVLAADRGPHSSPPAVPEVEESLHHLPPFYPFSTPFAPPLTPLTSLFRPWASPRPPLASARRPPSGTRSSAA